MKLGLGRVARVRLLVAAYLAGALDLLLAVWHIEISLRHGLFLLLTLAFVLVALGEFAARRLGASRALRQNLRFGIVFSMLLLTGVELFLRFGWARYVSYPERNVGHYRTYFVPIEAEKYDRRQQRTFAGPIHFESAIELPEFTQRVRTNALGLRGREVQPGPHPGVYRIIGIGDSFTEGFGASEAESWPLQLEAILNQRVPGLHTEVVNAGVAGSDPVFGYHLLREELLLLEPDAVILAVTENDTSDICRRGGFERYQPDGSVRYRPTPWWEWLYGCSYVFRHVLHDVAGYSPTLCSPEQAAACSVESRQTLREVVERTCELGEAQGFELVTAIVPMDYEMQTGRHWLLDLWPADPPACAHAVYLKDWFTRQGVTPENLYDYYYPLDRHTNPAGYRLLAEGLAEHLLEVGLGPDRRRHASAGRSP